MALSAIDPARSGSELDRHFALPAVRRVSPARPFHWLRLGWQDLVRNPAASLGQGLCFALAGFFILQFAAAWPHLFTTAVSGFLLLAPLLAAGLYEISRRRERGQPTRLSESFGAWRRNGASLSLFAVMLALTAVAWERISAILFALFYGGNAPDLRAFYSDVFLSGNYWPLVAAYLLIGALLAAAVFALTAVAAPMLVDRDVDAATAMATSLKAVQANPAPMLLWAALIVALSAIGFATLLLGMIVLVPLLGHATWHAYRELVD